MHVPMCFVSYAGSVLVCLHLIVIFTSYITIWVCNLLLPSYINVAVNDVLLVNVSISYSSLFNSYIPAFICLHPREPAAQVVLV